MRRETRRTRKRSWSYLLLSSRRIEGRDDSARIVINKQTRAFHHIRAVKRAPAIFLIIPGIQKAKQPVVRVMDIRLITTRVTLVAIATPFRSRPLAASFSMTHVSTADKIASYLRSLFFSFGKEKREKGKLTHALDATSRRADKNVVEVRGRPSVEINGCSIARQSNDKSINDCRVDS